MIVGKDGRDISTMVLRDVDWVSGEQLSLKGRYCQTYSIVPITPMPLRIKITLSGYVKRDLDSLIVQMSALFINHISSKGSEEVPTRK